MNAYVLIGSPNTRKSSICRALTGCFNRNIREIRTNHGQTLRTYVRVSALQESMTTPAAYMEEANARAVRNVLFSIWPHQRLDSPNDFPDAPGYLNYFADHGWKILSIAILGQNTAHLDAKTIKKLDLVNHPLALPNSFMEPVNVTAAAVRKHFGWI